MDYVGMDLGKKDCQIATITEAGELVEKRMRTGPPQQIGLENATG